MSLRATHLGYGYQDLMTAIRLIDVVLGRVDTVIVDTKTFVGDLFDDLTCVWPGGARERLQIKHTATGRSLPRESFASDRRGLRLGKLVKSIDSDLRDHPDTVHRLALCDLPPDDASLVAVLLPVDPTSDPGPAVPGLSSSRMRFDAVALRSIAPWRSSVVDIDDTTLRQFCDDLVIDVGMPQCSLDIRDPGPAEQALLRRIADELGAGRPPNKLRTPEDVALALIEVAKAARSLDGTVTIRDLLPRLDLTVDYGAVHEGNPVDRTAEISRDAVLDRLTSEVTDPCAGSRTVVLSAGPGTGKSWLCEQLADRLQDSCIVARHHCWLGMADTHRDRRVLIDVVIGSLLQQLTVTAPRSVADLRPRFAATAENLQSAVANVRRDRPDVPVLLIVDGLDHVTRLLGRTEGAAVGSPLDPTSALVAELAALRLPDGAYLLLASQPGDHLRVLGASVELTVPPLDRTEVRTLAERLGVLSAFPPAMIAGSPGRFEDAVDIIHTRSHGNALYATYLSRQAVGSPPVSTDEPGQVLDPLDRLRDVPASADDLDAYYAYLLRGVSPGQHLAVGLLAVCDFAVTADELREIVPQAALGLPAALRSVAPIIAQHPGIGGLKIHHESFSRFIRNGFGDDAWMDAVRTAAAAWLVDRGFFADARAFRHLPELLVALGRDEELTALVGPDFVSRAVAELQPPAAVAHVLTIAARSHAARCDWPGLVRVLQLRNAAHCYERDGIPDTVVDHADVLVDILGADVVAAALVYDGRTTVDVRCGLQLCAAIDAAGEAAPWAAYLQRWDEPRTEAGHSLDDDHGFRLAVLRGRYRVSGPEPDCPVVAADGDADNAPLTRRLVDLLQQDLPVRGLLDLVVDVHGAGPSLDGARMIEQPGRRAEALLRLADLSAAGRFQSLPPAQDLAIEAWQAAPESYPRRMLGHGVPVADLAAHLLGSDIHAVLEDATTEVLDEGSAHRPDVVRLWLARISVAHAVDRRSPTRMLRHLEGDGFYRAWLRFAVATVGLRRDLEAGSIGPGDASSAVRVALDRLADASDPFSGRPRAVDLWSLHGLVHQVVREAVALVRGCDLEPAMTALASISTGTTTRSNLGTPQTGPLITTDLLALLGRTVGRTNPTVVHQLADQLRRAEAERSTTYPELAGFELEMARINLTACDPDEAAACWRRAARFLSCYGSHKDPTIYELLDVLPDLAETDSAEARSRLARVHRLVHLVRKHTNGRGTSGTSVDWWRHLAGVDPHAAADLAATILLTEPGLEDGHAEAAHLRLVRDHAATADPVILAALRLTTGSDGRDTSVDAVLIDRVADLNDDDPARARGALLVLANAIAATYDDQALTYASAPGADHGLRDALRRVGADAPPDRLPAARSADQSGRGSPLRPSLQQVVHANQRPDMPDDAAGVVLAIRDHAAKPYGDDSSPRWAPDALANAVGWRILGEADEHGVDAAIHLLYRAVDELAPVSDRAVLVDLAHGLDIRLDPATPAHARLTCTAYVLAFTTLRGGGGWLTFSGRERPELWQRAVALDADTASALLAARVVATIEGQRYDNFGVTQALVAAFTNASPDPTNQSSDTAFDCWDAAFTIIEQRLPGTTSYDGGTFYEPVTSTSTAALGAQLARLAVATVAKPARCDRRRALVATTALLASRPAEAQSAVADVLAADLGSGPITWLLTVVENSLELGELTDELAECVAHLARSDLLSVRAAASRILEAADRPVPAAPATAAHPLLRRALADNDEDLTG